MPASPVPVHVADASALVELLLGTAIGRNVADALRGQTVAVPGHADAEVLSALGRLVRGREVTGARAESALRELARAPLERYHVHPLLQESWSLRQNVSLRDALYVSLARRLDATLVTTDAPLSRIRGLGVAVTLIRA
jgi:predicted nucleic acid-binding protein